MKQLSRFHEEDYFNEFKNEILSIIDDDNYKTSPTFFRCNSFYDIFINSFNQIHHFAFDSKNPNEKSNSRALNCGIRIPYSNFKPLKGEDLHQLKDTVEKTYRTMASKISCSRGNAFLLCENYKTTNNYSKANKRLHFYTNIATGKTEHIGKIIINQIAPKTYAVLDLANLNEVEYNNSIFNYSFALPCIVFANYACGDIFFFNDKNLDFARVNIIDFINSDKEKTDTIQHKFSRTGLKELTIKMFLESDLIYSVKVNEIAFAGRLRERESYFNARINFKENKWLSFEGHSYLESLK
ncbi:MULTISPECIES: hypothetical protein [unclassified Carboxylicivirga]|uniref:hypothetical protein n=1 Tax=Carboxylicivirga TaxID=1628153 RepID=UPI003D326FF6